LSLLVASGSRLVGYVVLKENRCTPHFSMMDDDYLVLLFLSFLGLPGMVVLRIWKISMNNGQLWHNSRLFFMHIFSSQAVLDFIWFRKSNRFKVSFFCWQSMTLSV
jgi:hypothetical protein